MIPINIKLFLLSENAYFCNKQTGKFVLNTVKKAFQWFTGVLACMENSIKQILKHPSSTMESLYTANVKLVDAYLH